MISNPDMVYWMNVSDENNIVLYTNNENKFQKPGVKLPKT
jgi:hypothetical protein